MQFTLHQVTVSNWSKDPFLNLGTNSRHQLGQAIIYSRQIADDACTLLARYQMRQITATLDKQMAKDFFNDGKDAVREALAKYFGLSKNDPNHQTDIGVVLGKFRQIKAGISGPFELVVGYIHDMDDVRDGAREAFNSLRRGSVKEAMRDLSFIRKGTEGWVASGGKHTRSRIHLNKNSIKTLSAGKIARIIVHEASHKFANTADVTMIDGSGDEHVGYKWDGLKHNATGFTNLTNNADSYAWGGRLIWKRHRNLNSGV